MMDGPVHSQKCHAFYKPPDYKLQELIGSGSFSDVYRATHTESFVSIALKIFRHKMRTMASYRAAATEVAFLELLEHPNILKLKVYEINKTYVYIGTEFAPYGTLRQYINDRKPLPEPIIQFTMKQLIAALSYLHAMGILHGDIKPENILCTNISENGPVIKIGDFGLSEIRLKGTENTVYKSGSFLYMAPEVHLRYPADCSCDLWSAGVLMYVMMFSRNIFIFSEQDRDKQKYYLKRRVPPNWVGSTAFSVHCNTLVRNLLSYDKQNRMTGIELRSHPFLCLTEPLIDNDEIFALSSQESIRTAVLAANEKKYGEALVEGTKAVMHLKIFHNLITVPDKRSYLRRKCLEYEDFTSNMERALILPDDTDLNCPEKCTESELRKYLVSTPKLLDGYDIGCNAEMFLKEGHKDKALHMFHEALQVLLPLMKNEPKSNRKDLLGKKLKKWIDYVEDLTEPKPPAESDQESSSAGGSGVPPL